AAAGGDDVVTVLVMDNATHGGIGPRVRALTEVDAGWDPVTIIPTSAGLRAQIPRGVPRVVDVDFKTRLRGNDRVLGHMDQEQISQRVGLFVGVELTQHDTRSRGSVLMKEVGRPRRRYL